ncbi:cytochrome c oxidase assembly factor Coa1 family protein [Seonamhaeicola marinus]|uniref:Cytochrome oxidase complex assembly protein 1 n=1 Tax=Seonamhaeicola marinus TaxID=1912246 RepID=A0A5D0HRQ1_9FLAO|nr:cytochrome c oxidase assembly factor Coa1 family protein [Seonamhaeicola marinus]TYA73925.1 hypothetical protein FUA24_11285 [Seonamhaeicola marinus]
MEELQRKNWFGRNWKWAVPIGECLTLIVLGILGLGSLIFGVTKMFKSSEPYTYAFEQASVNENVVRLIGEPIETDGIINGNISLSDNDGDADFSIPIAGPKGKANIVIKAKKTDGDWSYEELYVTIKASKEQINLLEKQLDSI